ncbi:MAG: LysM peptidoglycan-binding domain-containing protein [Thiopseudomonas sp.]|nr:LysM peptidoglycan-binding domain-containing protein [Thiopseudomonas sp.]MCK9465712.1 LysM peptidoglycan-binding domain-containing protein [Thiopseudomonas sp.]
MFKLSFSAIRLPAVSGMALCAVVLSGCQSLSNDSAQAFKPASTSAKTQHYTQRNQHKKTVSQEILQLPEPEYSQAQAHEMADIWSRIRQGYQLVDLVSEHPRIEKERLWFGKRTRSLEIIAERSNPYIHYIVEQLEEHSMPLELALLPAIESAYNPLALSSQRASGLWQFMPATGRNFKLEQTHWYDARRDITRSTKAAITYLNYLNKMFDGDWLLTLAAYNAGEGTVMNAIKRNRAQGLATDYWNLKLPPQTQAYVPKLLALAQIFAEPDNYSLQLPEIANEPFFTKVKFKHELELKNIAKMAKVDYDQLYQLNPAFNQKVTLGGPGYLLVPTQSVELLHQRLSTLKAPELYQWPTYTVRSGDTLSRIAQQNSTSVTMLRDLNRLSNNNLKIGQVLKIPPKAGTVAVASSTNKISYKVTAGDSLSTIAEQHQVSVKEIKQWNKLKGDSIRIGQALHIQSPATFYTVRTGDSLESIASRHNISITQLKNWNMLNSNLLKPGQKLALYL